MKIFRISNVLSLLIATFFGVLLFWTSQSVQQKEDQLAVVKKDLAQEDETIRVLSVEWDYLNRPQRLEELATQQLGMVSASGKEVVKTVNDIPEPVFEDDYTQAISLEPEQKQPAKKEGAVLPSASDKLNFYQLIQSLDKEGAGTP